MNSLFFVVCIVAIACTASTVQHYMKLRAGKQDNSSELQETLLQLEQIEKRLNFFILIPTAHALNPFNPHLPKRLLHHPAQLSRMTSHVNPNLSANQICPRHPATKPHNGSRLSCEQGGAGLALREP